MSEETPWIWTVRVYEKPDRRGRVTATRYSVLESTEALAIAAARAHHETEACPETHDARYVAERGASRVVQAGSLVTMSRDAAEKSVAAGLA